MHQLLGVITLSFSLRGIEGDMAQSLSNVLIHTVFSTKDRCPHIIPALQPEIHAYLAKICQSLGCFVFKIGGEWKITSTQGEHHKDVNFKTEFLNLLRKNNLSFNEE